jgi:hypothetical protein
VGWCRGEAVPILWGGSCGGNPVVSFAFAAEETIRGIAPRQEFWTSFWVQHGLAWVALMGACAVLPHRWRDRADSTRNPAAVARDSVSPEVHRDRAEILDEHPFAWIVDRERRPVVVTWIGLGILGAGWTWGFIEVREEWLQGFIGLWTVFFGAVWLKLRLATVACRHLHEHRRTGALELVLCTDQTPDTVVQGYLAGLRRQIFPPLATVLATGGLLMVAGLGQDLGGGETGELLLVFGVGAGVLVLDLWTLAWVGMWQGLQSPRYVRAYGVTVASVLLLPWVLFVVSAILIAVGVEVLQVGPAVDPAAGTILFWWLALAVGVDVWLLVTCRRRLHERFRDLAVGHYGPLRPEATAAPAPAPVPALASAPAVGSVSGKPS